MTPSQILAIPVTQPWRLFQSPNGFTDEVRALRRKWHPNMNRDPVANEVMAHINVLADVWLTDSGSRVGFLSKHLVDGVCQCVVKSEKVTYAFNDDALDLRLNGWQQTFRFANDKMRADMEHLFPKFDKVDPNELFFVKKSTQLNLADVLKSQGTIPVRHVAWIMNRLYNIACYLSWAEVPHLDISLQNLYIDPSMHSVHLYGGWWYGRGFYQKALGAPSWLIELSAQFRATGIPTRKLISQQIKEVGRLLLGAPSKGALLQVKDVPEPLVKWLVEPCVMDPVKEYAEWGRCLNTSFGPRKFIVYDLKESDVYKVQP